MIGILRALIALYPRPFREKFGAALQQHIDDEYTVRRRAGAVSVLMFFLSTAADLLRSNIAEHLNPTWRVRLAPPRQEGRMSVISSSWARDLQQAVRSLLRAPAFTTVTVITLGLAIGVNAGMFTVVRTVLLDPLPYHEPGRLMHIAATAPGSGMPDEFGVSDEFLVHYAERSKLIEDVSTYNSFTNTFRVDDRVERIRMSYPTHSFFRTLGVKPLLGRTPLPEDEDRVIVLSHELWTTWFGSDSTVIGRVVDVLGGPRTIIGVMGSEFAFPLNGTMLWGSTVLRAEGIQPGRFNSPLVARVRPGVTPEQLAAELTQLATELPARFGGSANYARLIAQHRAIVRPIGDEMLGAVSRPLLVLLGAVGVVLLIACANVANLFAVRAESRQRDLAVRRAIGAGRGQLIQTQLAESFVVAAFSAALALLLAAVTLPLFLQAAPAEIPRINAAHLDASTLLFTGAAALLGALVCGLIPAIRASAPSMMWLREGARGTRRRSWGRDSLVVVQTALALVLLIGSALLLRSFAALSKVDPGYDTQDIFTFQIAPEGPHLPDGVAYARFAHQFMQRLAALPGVESVGLVENVPLNEGTALAPFRTDDSGAAATEPIRFNYTFAAGDYYRTMGIALLQGRGFVESDHNLNARNLVVSQGAAQRLWPGVNAVGQRLRREGSEDEYTVVGVVEDVMQNDLREPAQPTVYLPIVGPEPMSWVINSPAYVVKTPRAESISAEIRAIVREVAPEAPMYRTFTMAGLARDSMIRVTFTMLTLGIISALALVLGAIGLYGVLSYVVAQRTREIGVRLALGAEAGRVRRMVVAQGIRLVMIGVIGGVLVALASTRALDTLLFGVTRFDTLTFALTSTWIITVGLLASWIPALRASRVDPIRSLKE